MILTPILLLILPGVRVGVQGEGKLRFADGPRISLAAAATLAPNSAGFLADVAGRPVLPQLRVAGAFSVASDGTVSLGGKRAGRLVLERTDGEVGFPGEASFGVLKVGGAVPAPKKAVPGGATIGIRPRSELLGDRVLLRDVADISGDDATVARLGAVDLGAVPSIGVSRSLSSWTVKSALRNQGFRDGSVTVNYPPDAMVARKGQTIDSETLVAEATAKARELVGEGELAPVALPASLLVPCGKVGIDASASRNGGSVSATVNVTVDGKKAGSCTVRFTAKTAAKGAGIKSGDAVRIKITRNGAIFETDGKAKSAGLVGETIQIVTPDGATLTATVTGPGSVEVNL